MLGVVFIRVFLLFVSSVGSLLGSGVVGGSGVGGLLIMI